MELKQATQRKKDGKTPSKETAVGLSDHLADIELKLDHIIERLRDSLYQRGLRGHGEDDA